jgi:integrase
MQANSHLKLVAPKGENRAVAPVRRPNSEFRSREHLTPTEVEKLIEAAKTNRHGLRDATMVLVAYRHALRASEVCDLGFLGPERRIPAGPGVIALLGQAAIRWWKKI